MVTNKEKNFVSIVLYVHNDENQIEKFLEKVHTIFSEKFEKFEIICVNDNCTDSSVEKIKAFALNAKNSVVSIVNMSIYQGNELSMNAGVDLSIGDFVFEFDSPNIEYPINTIMEVYHHSLKGFDIVSASPENINRFSSKLFYKLFNQHGHSPYMLRTESFRVLSRRAINRVQSISQTIPYRKAVYANSGLKMDTITYKQIENISNKESKQSSQKRRTLAIDSLVLFTDVAYKISLTLALSLLFFTIFAGGYTVVIYLGNNKPIIGWTTTMLFLSGGFFGVFTLFAIVIKYLSLLVDLVFKKQKYLINSIEKISK